MDKTILDNNITQIEKNDNKTMLESNLTHIENNKDIFKNSSIDTNKNKLDSKYNIIKQLPTSGAEADLFIVEKENKEYILKLYRHEVKPSKELIDKLVNVSKKYPEDIVKIYEINFNKKLNKWFEIQEYIKFGSLKDFLENKNNNEYIAKNINKIIEEILLLLKSIHDENIIHRDLKPDNILIRTLEPLDLVITDFGISSLIDEEMSKKMTSKSGTRMYFSPESFSGVIGKEVDYWALGMIILEILEDGNLFSGMHEGIIANEIFTKGIKIPDNIDNNLQLLLKGLLTRDPKYRWGYTQVIMWLKGDRTIPIHYNYNYSTKSSIKPYVFENEQFYDLKNLLIKFYNESNYEKFKEHIMRGYIIKWLEENENYDDAICIDKYKKSTNNIDLNMYVIFNYYVKSDNFLFMGKLINIKNLYIYCLNCLNNQANDIEILIYNHLKEGFIKKAYLIFKEKTYLNEEMDLFFYQLEYLKYDIEIFSLLKIILDKKLSYDLIKNNKKEIISQIGIKKIYEIFNEKNYIFPNNFVHNIKTKNDINIELLDEYLTNETINKFLEFKDSFQMNDITLEKIISDEKLYYRVLSIIKRTSDESMIKKYLYIYDEIHNNPNILENLEMYMGNFEKIKNRHELSQKLRKRIRNQYPQIIVSNAQKNGFKTSGFDSYQERAEQVIRTLSLIEKHYPYLQINWEIIKQFTSDETKISENDINILYDLILKSNNFAKIQRRFNKFNISFLALSSLVFMMGYWFYGSIMLMISIILIIKYFKYISNNNLERY